MRAPKVGSNTLATAVATSAGGLLIAARRRVDHYVEPQAASSAARPASILSTGIEP